MQKKSAYLEFKKTTAKQKWLKRKRKNKQTQKITKMRIKIEISQVFTYFECKIKNEKYTHVCTAIGTATTMAGLLMNADKEMSILGFPVIKNMVDIQKRLKYLLPQNPLKEPVIFSDYHFGGYAKKNKVLIDFMNAFYTEYNIPTDFVYTGKMMFGLFDLLKKGYFENGSKVLCIHTGGLQGNKSLPSGTLVF